MSLVVGPSVGHGMVRAIALGTDCVVSRETTLILAIGLRGRDIATTPVNDPDTVREVPVTIVCKFHTADVRAIVRAINLRIVPVVLRAAEMVELVGAHGPEAFQITNVTASVFSESLLLELLPGIFQF